MGSYYDDRQKVEGGGYVNTDDASSSDMVFEQSELVLPEETKRQLEKLGIRETMEDLYRKLSGANSNKKVYLINNKLAALGKFASIVKMATDVSVKQEKALRDKRASDEGEGDYIGGIEVSLKR